MNTSSMGGMIHDLDGDTITAFTELRSTATGTAQRDYSHLSGLASVQKFLLEGDSYWKKAWIRDIHVMGIYILG